jgi:MFS family permease
MSVLLYRNFFYPSSGGNTALGHYLLVVVASALGYGAAALVTPVVTRRMTKAAVITLLLAIGGLTTGLLGLGFEQAGFLAIGFILGVVAQGIAICSTTILQQEVDDDFRGRVFSIYDMLYNASFAVGAAGSALFLPVTGRSYPMLATVAVGYLVAAGAYWILSRQSPTTGPSEGSGGAETGGSGTGRPAPAAQPSSS